MANVLAILRATARRLGGTDADYDDVIEAARERSFVLLGEATHGTDEFYRMRAAITRRLFDECGYDAVAVEADLPDAYRLHRFVMGDAADTAAIDAFADFARFPRWMWRNEAVLEFITRLRARNDASRDAQAGFYGLDMYSMYRSAEAVIAYLDRVDYEQSRIAKRQYAALDHVREPEVYGYEAVHGLRPDCRDEVRARLMELIRRKPEYLSLDGRSAADAQFFAERNAHVVASAEAYYREMFEGRVQSWNRRDLHMTETLFALQAYLRETGRRGRIVIWAHNSHLGDARATEMSQGGEWNVGQLMRERAGAENVFSVGFTTYAGTVTAAREWNGPAERRTVQPALPDSYEDLFRRSRLDAFYLPLQGEAARALREPRLERAIGVLYLPETEYASHYFAASLPLQFDAVIHLDETRAVEPLDDEGFRRARAA